MGIQNLPAKELLLAKAIALELLTLSMAEDHSREHRDIVMFGRCPVCRQYVNPDAEMGAQQTDAEPHLPSCPHRPA